ncbi:SSI family serine proteinase inhibitor [Streptomyces sp. NPDC008313]|uniref:SSI family serine proteinase inhibitor n=1 Tax=Streptomyces sp. NPDC008313 TaxID=3364826 RepID=UPI0036F0DC9C
MTNTTHTLRTGLAAAALLLAGAAPALAASPSAADSENWLYVTVTQGEDNRAGDSHGTLLLCDPPQGHAHAAEACDELGAAQGDVGRIPAKKEVYCSMIYAPVTVTAQGEWNGRRTEYQKTYPNACTMEAETGAVFALSD